MVILTLLYRLQITITTFCGFLYRDQKRKQFCSGVLILLSWFSLLICQIMPKQDVFEILLSKVYSTQFFVPPMMHFRHRSVCSCLYFLSKDFILIPHLEQKFAPTPNRNRLMRQSLQWNIWHKVNQFCLKSQTSSTCPRTFCTNRLSKNHYGFANGIVAVVCHNLTELPQML